MANVCRDWVHDAPGDDVVWTFDGADAGVETFIGKADSSEFFAFKGVGVVDAPLAKVANVLIDTSRHHEWVPHFGGMRVVRAVSEKEKIIYRHVLTPFIISDRDFVVHVKVNRDDRSDHLVINFRSVEDSDVPVSDDKVRGMLHSSGYRLWSIDSGKRTMVLFTVHVDPKGNVPAWIVNLFQSGYARNNLENIRAQAARGDVVAHPDVAALFKNSKASCEAGPMGEAHAGGKDNTDT